MNIKNGLASLAALALVALSPIGSTASQVEGCQYTLVFDLNDRLSEFNRPSGEASGPPPHRFRRDQRVNEFVGRYRYRLRVVDGSLRIALAVSLIL